MPRAWFVAMSIFSFRAIHALRPGVPASRPRFIRERMMPLSRYTPVLIATLVLGHSAERSEAQWAPGGVRLCQVGCSGVDPRMTPDGAGGAFVVWRESSNRPVTDIDVYLQ